MNSPQAPHPSTAWSWAEVEESGMKSKVEAGGRLKIRGEVVFWFICFSLSTPVLIGNKCFPQVRSVLPLTVIDK